ncbi:MAG: CUAEP/CCAEP-tail radical SAM (seleno)protein [Egibacteraceae bacterium]
MRVLLISSYELGHQPVHVASPAAALRAAGHEVRGLDLSVEAWDDGAVAWAEAVGLSVPMHTAMRLALRAAEVIRRLRPALPLCFYGLYAPVSRDLTVGRLADRVLAGEYEPALVAWVDGLEVGTRDAGPPAGAGEEGLDAVDASGAELHVGRGRGRFHLPARGLLPPLERYARLAIEGEERLVGAVEATHGCRYECRHCPVPTVYGGAFRVVGSDVVLADIAQLVEAGARHITFSDPDFLNGPGHAMRIVRAMRQRFGDLTFDCTVKVEHILRHAALWPELAASGCVFAVTAVECVNDRILALLDKGHTAADAARAVDLLREHGIEPRPSLMPFTPWSTVSDVVDILDFVIAHDLVGNVDPIQYTIRLLLPQGSLLLDRPQLAPHLGPYDAEQLSYQWRPADPCTDALQAELAALAAVGIGSPPGAMFLAVNAAVRLAAGERTDLVLTGPARSSPRLTEPWFC